MHCSKSVSLPTHCNRLSCFGQDSVARCYSYPITSTSLPGTDWAETCSGGSRLGIGACSSAFEMKERMKGNIVVQVNCLFNLDYHQIIMLMVANLRIVSSSPIIKTHQLVVKVVILLITSSKNYSNSTIDN